MSNLASFTELLRLATEDKKARIEEDNSRKKREVVPLLSELFASVAKAKETQKVVLSKPLPLVSEIEYALLNPKKFSLENHHKKVEVLDFVDEVSEKAKSIEFKLASTDKSTPPATDLEKKFLKLFNKIQNDFQTLKKFVEARPSGAAGGWSAGSGEVRILRMDDVERRLPEDGTSMVWDAKSSLFRFQKLVAQQTEQTTIMRSSTTSSTTLNTTETTTIQFKANSSGALFFEITLTTVQYSSGYSLQINGLTQNKNYYVVNSSGISVPASLCVETGDLIDFTYYK